MIHRLLIMAALLVGLDTGAVACAVGPEELEMASSDAVVDGVAICSVERGRCRLHAREMIKHDDRRMSDSPYFTLRFDPEARARLARYMEETGDILMCVNPWEPRRTRVEGRFYLTRDGSAYRVRQSSDRGDEDSDIVEEAAE